MKDYREIDGTTGSYPACGDCFNISTEELLKREEQLGSKKTKISPEVFAAVCYLVLMDHHGRGYINAHPSYAMEKLAMLKMGLNAIAILDGENKEKVLKYLEYWKYEI